MADGFGSWLYAVTDGTPGEWLRGANGVGGQPVHTVAAAGLTAAVTSVSLADFGEEPLRRNLENLAWLEAAARRHHHVIEIIARHAPVIPIRLATVYRSDEGVAALLSARRRDFAASLGRVSSQTEWGVKVYAAQPRAAPGQPAAAAGDPPGAVPEPSAAGAAAGAATGSGGPGAAYLRRRRQQVVAAEDARQAAVASAQAIHATLGRLATAALLRAPQDAQLSGQASRMVLNAAYLVPDERASEFGAAARKLADVHPGVIIEPTGPWPPYSFAAVDQHEMAGPHAAAGPAG